MKRATFTAIALLFLGCSERVGDDGVTTVSGATPATQSTAASGTTPQRGDVAPDFSLADQTGARLRLSDVRGEKVVLVFYRGYWWPYCTRQVAGLRSLLRPGEQIRLWAISPDSGDESGAFIRKIEADGNAKVNFSLLSDPGSEVIDRYALRDPAYAGQEVEGIPHPAVFVLDRDGRVVWSRIETDYKQRPSNEEIRAALDSVK